MQEKVTSTENMQRQVLKSNCLQMQYTQTQQQTKTETIMALSFIDRIKATLSGTPTNTPSVPVAVSTQVQADNSAEVKFGFSQYGQVQYDPNQTYADFAAGQAKIAGISLQTNYTAQYIVGGQTFVVDPELTFAELNAKYAVTPETSVSVSIPDPERPAGELG